MIPATPGPSVSMALSFPTISHGVSLPQVVLRKETWKSDRFATPGGWAHRVSDACRTFTLLSSTHWGNQDSLQSQTNGFQLRFLQWEIRHKSGFNLPRAKRYFQQRAAPSPLPCAPSTQLLQKEQRGELMNRESSNN